MEQVSVLCISTGNYSEQRSISKLASSDTFVFLLDQQLGGHLNPSYNVQNKLLENKKRMTTVFCGHLMAVHPYRVYLNNSQ